MNLFARYIEEEHLVSLKHKKIFIHLNVVTTIVHLCCLFSLFVFFLSSKQTKQNEMKSETELRVHLLI